MTDQSTPLDPPEASGPHRTSAPADAEHSRTRMASPTSPAAGPHRPDDGASVPMHALNLKAAGGLPLRWRTAAVWATGASVALAALLPGLVNVAVIDVSSDVPGWMWMMAICSGVAALSCVAGHELMVAGRRRLGSTTAGLGVVGSAIQAMLFTVLILTSFEVELAAGMLFVGVAMGAAAFLSVAGLMLIDPTPSGLVRVYRRVAIGVLGVGVVPFLLAGLMFSLLALWDLADIFGGTGAAPLQVGVMIIASLSYVCVLVGLVLTALIPSAVARSRRMRLRRSTTIDGGQPLTTMCPHCAVPCAAPSGTSQCRSCGGVIHVRIEEPECTCGYVLFRMSSNQCPECGAAVPDADRYQVSRMEAGRSATETVTETVNGPG